MGAEGEGCVPKWDGDTKVVWENPSGGWAVWMRRAMLSE